MPKKKKGYLNEDDIRKGTLKGLKKYKKLKFLERFAMYMGIAQLLEIILKQILSEKFSYPLDKTERWTLGHVVSELKKNKLREDIFLFLDSIVEDRNYIAHDLLANHILINTILNSKKSIYSKEIRRLKRAIYELEQVYFIIDWTNQHKGW